MMIEVKICENCKHRNPVIAVECEKCGYDLTFVYPEKVEENDVENEITGSPKDTMENAQDSTVSCQDTGESRWTISSVSDERGAIVIDGETSVGRDCDLFNAKFNSSNYTSRIHAKLRIIDGKLQVMDASTNGTFVEDRRIPKMEWINLDDGNTIRFADVSFVVRRV